MASKVLLDLAMKLSADSAELRREVQKSNESLKSIRENTANTGQQMQAAFLKITAAVGAARAVIHQFRDVINSTMTTADQFRQVSDGLAGAMGSFNRSIATGNFAGFINNLNAAYNAAKRYSDVLDELNKKQLAVTLQDVGLATEVFRLDQIIHAEESSADQVRNALDRKEEIYRNHYAEVERLARENQQALLDRAVATIGRETGSSPEDVSAAFGYMTNYNRYDEERKSAQAYFDILDKIKSIESMERNIGAIAAPVNVGGMVKRESGIDPAQAIREAQEEADRLFGSLDGFSKWLAENRDLINLVTPIQDEIIEAEKALLLGGQKLEQAMAQVIRQRRRVSSRMNSQGTTGEEPEYPDPVDVTVPVVVDPVVVDWKELKGVTSPGTGDMIKLPEKTMDPKSMFSGYLEEVERVTEATQQFQMVATGAAQGIASAFVDMAFGAKMSIQEIIEEMLKMIAMQLISSLIGNLFSGGAGAVSSIGKIGTGSTGNNPLMMSAFKGLTGVPKMASGGIAYGPSVVQIGEYAGANIDPEIVSRASDLKRLLGYETKSGTDVDVTVHGALSGMDLMISGQRAQRMKKLYE